MRSKFFITIFILSFLSAVSATASEFLLRCRWTSPNTMQPQTITFANNPLIAVPPGGTIQVTASTLSDAPAELTVLKNGQPVSRGRTLDFAAPAKSGAHYISFRVEAGGASEEREICVVVPYKASARRSGKGWEVFVDGESVGTYRDPSTSGSRKVRENPESYQPPVWWLRITPTNGEFEVVPGVRAVELVVPTEETGLRHTDLVPVCYPMWRAITTLRLALLEKLGIPASAVKLISMFRTPTYNRLVGSNAFGRHVYGDSFDFYIDLTGGGKAADLNRDRRLDRRDAYPVVAVMEALQDDGKVPMGGVGVYNTQGGDHEVTMHMDMRGHRATWGYLTTAGGNRSEFSWQSSRFGELDRHEENLAAEKAAAEGRNYSRPNREPLPEL